METGESQQEVRDQQVMEELGETNSEVGNHGKAVAEGKNSVINSPEGLAKAYDKILKSAPSFASASSPSESFIFKTPPKLRQVNEKAFKPQIISIGPSHSSSKLSYILYNTMDIQKVRYLKKVLERLASAAEYGGANEDVILKSLFDKAESIEEQARNCYEVMTGKMPKPDFVKMMVLDGLFVVELLRKFHNLKLREENDIIFKQNSNLTIIAQDLLLLENQLPFFVLDLLFEQTKIPEEPSNMTTSLQDLASFFFSIMVPAVAVQQRDDGGNAGHIKHLLGLVHNRCLPRPSPQSDEEDNKHLLGLVHNCCLQRPSPQRDEEEFTFFVQMHSLFFGKLDQWELDILKGSLSFIRSATRLKEAGISFKKHDEGNSLFDIKFENGEMHIPTLKVDHDTERIFRNLIAYEQSNQVPSIVMDYTRLMDCLINYADDVALLSDSGIIDNMLGTNEDVANMFNKLNEYVYLSTANFYYFALFKEVDKYCNRRWNKWKVELKQKYFNNPWYWILASIAAALLLLLLTMAQTLYTILSYYE